MVRVSMCYLFGFTRGVLGHEEHLDLPLLLDGQGQREVAEGVKGHGDLVARGADERGLEQPVEGIHNHRVVPLQVVVPCFLGHLLRHG